jgi:hypothetical protein
MGKDFEAQFKENEIKVINKQRKIYLGSPLVIQVKINTRLRFHNACKFKKIKI